MVGIGAIQHQSRRRRRRGRRLLQAAGRVRSAWHRCARIGAAVRTFLVEVDAYAELVDGFKNVLHRQRHVFERIGWLGLTCAFIYGACYTCSVQWNRFVAHPTVISLERDYRSWNATLPGITLCYVGRVNAIKSDQYLLRYGRTKYECICLCTEYSWY